MGPPHNLQHQAPPHYVRNSCILNIFIETISIYILGLRRTTHLIDAIQKYYHYSRAHACVCVCVSAGAYALAPDFRVLQLSQIEFSPIPTQSISFDSTSEIRAEFKARARTVARVYVVSVTTRATTMPPSKIYILDKLLACDTLRSTLNFYCVKNHINMHFE